MDSDPPVPFVHWSMLHVQTDNMYEHSLATKSLVNMKQISLHNFILGDKRNEPKEEDTKDLEKTWTTQ